MTEVDQPSAEVAAMAPDWELAAALLGGTRAMRNAGPALLPKWPNEDSETYDSRLATSTLFPAYSRTVQTLAGKPFSKPITIGPDVPPELVQYFNDIDLEGRNLDAFSSDLMECALGYGLTGILIDFPVTQAARSLSEERAQGLRPYWVHIKPAQILGWRARRLNSAWSLDQLRLKESVQEPSGAWGVIEVQQVRVLAPNSWAIYRQNAEKKWVLHSEGATSLGYVPFVPVYGGRTAFMCARPPLIEMAHLNVQHWQSSSDQNTILHVARVPILVVVGIDDDKWSMTVGASSAVKLPIGSEMKYVEHTGAAIQAGADSLSALEEQMRQSGAELLVIDQKITATQVNAESAVGMCALQRISQNLEGALDRALKITAEWSGLKTGGHVTIFNDFAGQNLADASAQLILSAQQTGLISKATAIGELKRRGTLSPEIDAELEAASIEAQGPELGAE